MYTVDWLMFRRGGSCVSMYYVCVVEMFPFCPSISATRCPRQNVCHSSMYDTFVHVLFRVRGRSAPVIPVGAVLCYVE